MPPSPTMSDDSYGRHASRPSQRVAMEVLTVYALPDPKSFCRAVLKQLTDALREAVHTVEGHQLLHEQVRPDVPHQRHGQLPAREAELVGCAAT